MKHLLAFPDFALKQSLSERFLWNNGERVGEGDAEELFLNRASLDNLLDPENNPDDRTNLLFKIEAVENYARGIITNFYTESYTDYEDVAEDSTQALNLKTRVNLTLKRLHLLLPKPELEAEADIASIDFSDYLAIIDRYNNPNEGEKAESGKFQGESIFKQNEELEDGAPLELGDDVLDDVRTLLGEESYQFKHSEKGGVEVWYGEKKLSRAASGFVGIEPIFDEAGEVMGFVTIDGDGDAAAAFAGGAREHTHRNAATQEISEKKHEEAEADQYKRLQINAHANTEEGESRYSFVSAEAPDDLNEREILAELSDENRERILEVIQAAADKSDILRSIQSMDSESEAELALLDPETHERLVVRKKTDKEKQREQEFEEIWGELEEGWIFENQDIGHFYEIIKRKDDEVTVLFYESHDIIRRKRKKVFSKEQVKDLCFKEDFNSFLLLSTFVVKNKLNLGEEVEFKKDKYPRRLDLYLESFGWTLEKREEGSSVFIKKK